MWQPLPHGGDLSWVRRRFPDAPEPLLDLSTGINPHAYPLPAFEPGDFTRLPAPARTLAVRRLAASLYGAAGPEQIALAPGTQILLARLAASVEAGRAVVLGPTYAEHARAARLAGHQVTETTELAELCDCDLAILVNPNNPDGRLLTRRMIEHVLAKRAGRGLLVVDEAFMDVAPDGESVTALAGTKGLAVLRSFGKFYGMAGVRLGTLAAVPPLVQRIEAELGPWPASGIALRIAEHAMADMDWRRAMRARLAGEAERLDLLLATAGFSTQGTALFRLVDSPDADRLFEALGAAGLIARRFADQPTRLRVGLPPDNAAWDRLHDALAPFRR